MEDAKRMQKVKDHLSYALRTDAAAPFIPIWILREDAEMLVRWLDNRILWDQTYGKEGTP